MKGNRIALVVAAALLATTALASVNNPLPNWTSPVTNEPGQTNAALNTMNGNINNGVDGFLMSSAGSVVTVDTSADTLMSYTLPANALNIGQVLHIKAWGVNSADANVKTITFNFGSTSCAVIVTGSAAHWSADFYEQITAVGASPTQTDMCMGQQAATAITVNSAAGNTVATGSAVTVTATGTAATAGTITLQGGYMEALK